MEINTGVRRFLNNPDLEGASYIHTIQYEDISGIERNPGDGQPKEDNEAKKSEVEEDTNIYERVKAGSTGPVRSMYYRIGILDLFGP